MFNEWKSLGQEMGMEKARKGHFLQVFVCVEVTERMMFMHSTGISILN